MRRACRVSLLMWLGAATVVAGFQGGAMHVNALEPVTKSELKIPTDVIAGSRILKAGVYIVTCDREVVTFTLKATNETMASFECRGPMMKDKSKDTRAEYVPQPSGYIALEKLYLKGNNVEHMF